MFKLAMLRAARDNGWSTYTNTDGDIFHAFRPFAFPAYVEAVARGVDLTTLDLTAAITTSGANSDALAPARERARQACTRAVRRRAFTDEVVAAYGGRCAMCGLNFGLVDAAHIDPVEAAGSVDEVWNGLCLCPNHHRLFDAALVWVDPATGTIRPHPRLATAQTDGDRAVGATMLAALRPPADPRQRPRAEVFHRRYERERGRYGWLSE